MRKSTLDMLQTQIDSAPSRNNSKIKQEYVVSGSIPKTLGSSLAEQIRNSNNKLRRKTTY